MAVKRLWPHLRPYIPALIVVILLALPASGIKGLIVELTRKLTDDVLVNKDQDALNWLPWAMVGLGFANFVVRFTQNYINRAVATRIVQKIRDNLNAHILKLSIGYFGQSRGGELLSRIINDVQLITQGLSSAGQIVTVPLTLLVAFIYLFYLNMNLTLLTLMIAPLVAVLLSNSGKHTKRYALKIQQTLADLSSILSETFYGMRVIKGFNLENFMGGQFIKRNRFLTETTFKAIRVEELARPAMDFIAVSAMAAIAFYGGTRVMNGSMTAGDIFAFFVAMAIVIDSVRKLGELNIRMNQTAASVGRVFEILDQRPEILDSATAKAMPRFDHEIEFKNTAYRYEEAKENVLTNFNLQIKRGEMIALVGASGAGKSTLLSLLMRFHDPNAGSISIDGQDIRTFTMQSLREQVAIVTQEVFLFHDTIRTNIKSGNFDCTEEQIIDAAKAAQAWKFIENTPKGLDTVIGDRGQKLSGGERQRLSIARAILRDCPILLLDEATSALDAENERLVQAALDNLLKNRTSIVVAHRLSTIRRADRIIVLESGRIIEQGNHADLLAQDGAYAKALSLQDGFEQRSPN